ncbi:unnamed protein product [Caenorhabditis auriculariae]|uniref:C-type lectin domain-containing protein n=1 Tax=Caenorhabditis auriculariae TaxID=2777116 RepID=A0A8S1HN79_9PELO|nr:unnamed protein product [Caenorhabditis auriculariae]
MLLAFFLLLGLSTALAAHKSHKCPDDTWTMFARTGGRFWCMRFYHGKLNRNDAEYACRSHGANLTGFENENEFVFLRDTALREFAQYNLPKGGSYWLGGIRNLSCYGPGNNGCNSMNAFMWGNDLTQGTFAFTKWSEMYSEPNNAIHNGENENCMQGVLFYEYPNLNGKLNDYLCSLNFSWRSDLPMYTPYGTQRKNIVHRKKTAVDGIAPKDAAHREEEIVIILLKREEDLVIILLKSEEDLAIILLKSEEDVVAILLK